MLVCQAMCVRDEGGPLGAGLRRQASNHLVRLGSRTPVVNVKEKAQLDCVRCGSGRRTRVNHRRRVESGQLTSKPRGSIASGLATGRSAYRRRGVRHEGGASPILARTWNLGTCHPDAKGDAQMEAP